MSAHVVSADSAIALWSARAVDLVPVPSAQPRTALRVLLANDKLGIDNTRLHGAGRLLIDWTRALLDRNVDVTPVILRAAGPLGAEVRDAGLPFVFLDRSRFDPGTLVDLVRLIRRRRIQLLHLQGFGASLFGRVAGYLTGVPTIVHVHADHRYETGGYPFLLQQADRLLARRTNRVLAISNSVVQFAHDQQGFERDQITVCRSPIDRERFRPATVVERDAARRALGIPPHALVAVCVARLDEVKGVDILLSAWDAVVAEVPQAMLLLVGDGPQRAALEQHAADKPWADSVRFAGHRSDVETALWASDVAVVPSRYEGLSLAALEAMAAGLPVVASRVGGLPEVVQDGITGLLVTPESLDELARAVACLLTSAARREELGAAAAAASTAYDLQAFVEQLEAIYASVIASSP